MRRNSAAKLIGSSGPSPLTFRNSVKYPGSVANIYNSGAGTPVKPSGLQVGDLVIYVSAITGSGDPANTRARMYTNTGVSPNPSTVYWNYDVSVDIFGYGSSVCWKVLDAGDVANHWYVTDAGGYQSTVFVYSNGGKPINTAYLKSSKSNYPSNANGGPSYLNFPSITPATNSRSLILALCDRDGANLTTNPGFVPSSGWTEDAETTDGVFNIASHSIPTSSYTPGVTAVGCSTTYSECGWLFEIT